MRRRRRRGSPTRSASAVEPRSVREALAVADAARGAGKVLTVGASLGGRIALEAAADKPSALAGIVSVSGERTVDQYPDIRPTVMRVTVPVLYLGSRRDPLTDCARQPRALRQPRGPATRRSSSLTAPSTASSSSKAAPAHRCSASRRGPR